MVGETIKDLLWRGLLLKHGEKELEQVGQEVELLALMLEKSVLRAKLLDS